MTHLVRGGELDLPRRQLGAAPGAGQREPEGRDLQRRLSGLLDPPRVQPTLILYTMAYTDG